MGKSETSFLQNSTLSSTIFVPSLAMILLILTVLRCVTNIGVPKLRMLFIFCVIVIDNLWIQGIHKAVQYIHSKLLLCFVKAKKNPTIALTVTDIIKFLQANLTILAFLVINVLEK